MAVKTVAVYIGRFQPFHNGHAHILKQALEENDYVIVLVGSSYQASTFKNPFTFEQREAMIYNWMSTLPKSDTTPIVLSLVDYQYNNAKWIEQVQHKVADTIESWNIEPQDALITLYGSQRDSSTWYLDAFPQWGKRRLQPFPLNGNLTATSLRDNLFTGNLPPLWQDLPASSMEFVTRYVGTPACQRLVEEYNFTNNYKKQFGRGEIDKLIARYTSLDGANSTAGWDMPGIIEDLQQLRKSISPYPPVFVTTDAVVVQSGHVLVVERANLPGKGLWALPGGFLNQDERMLDGAVRELLEETGIRLAVGGTRAKEITEDILRNAVKGHQVFDHPERSLRGRTITQAFFFRLDDTKPLPKVKGMNVPDYESNGQAIVETAWAKWIPISEARANTDKWFEDHHSIVDTFLG